VDVLLVEDEPAMSAALRAVLESRGHAVTAVADGESGWASYQSRDFPMVIVDWLLPKMGGLELCRKIRSGPRGADSLILVVTGRTDASDLEQVLAAGADDYLAKPVAPRLLNIRLAIAEQRARDLMHRRGVEAARRAAVAARDQLETKLQLVLDNIPARVFWKDQESLYVGCNRLFAMDAGLQEPSQIVGKADRDLCWAGQAQVFMADDRAVMQSRLPKLGYEQQQTTPDGASICLVTSKIPLMDGDGNPIGVLGTYQDVTWRKRAETETFAAQSELAAMLDALPDLLFELDMDGYFHDYRASRPELLAVPPEVFLGKTMHDVLPPEAAEEAMSALREAHETGRSSGRQIELQVPQGRLWFELSTARKRVAAGAAPRYIMLSRDITERKLAEERLSESYQELERLTARLEVVREDEQQRIARELHDEMGGVLAGLNIHIHLLAAQIPADMTDVQARVANLERLVGHGIEALHRTVAELRPLLIDELGFMVAIEAYVDEFEANTEIECSLRLPEEDPRLDGKQSTALFRIVQESLTNVAKHARASSVSIVLTESDTALVLTVMDDGKGFDLEARKGTSFGLLGVRERAAMVGGTAQITSVAGKGTTVTVSLPRIVS
jgi:PAS domain S-box-containing protein